MIDGASVLPLVPERVDFRSGVTRCAGDLWLPAGATAASRNLPIVVLGHGLGATRDMRLDAFAQHFAAAGIAALTFDYRSFGDSGGEPRQVLHIGRQHEDWHAAIAYAKSRPEIDPVRVAIWGSSFGGGHVLHLAGTGAPIAAVVAQCPFTDGQASSRTLGFGSTVKIGARALTDQLGALVGRKPLLVPAAGAPGTVALMTAPDAKPGYDALMAATPSAADHAGIAARIGLRIGLYRPGKRLAKITVPTLILVCDPDTVAPNAATQRHIARAANPNIDARTYPYGHFDVYLGAPFTHVVADQTAFLRKALKVD